MSGDRSAALTAPAGGATKPTRRALSRDENADGASAPHLPRDATEPTHRSGTPGTGCAAVGVVRAPIREREQAAAELLEAELAYRDAQRAVRSNELDARRHYADCRRRLEQAQHRVEVMLERESIEPRLAMC